MLHRASGLWIIVFALSVRGAVAQGFSDPASGLAIMPPAGFVASQTATRPNYDVTVDVTGEAILKSVQPNGKLCTIGFKSATQNANLSRAEINAQMKRPEWRKLYVATFELIGSVTRTSNFTHQGYTGIAFELTPKAGPNAPNIRMHFETIETPKGRTVFSCVTDSANRSKAFPIFAAIRRGTRIPE